MNVITILVLSAAQIICVWLWQVSFVAGVEQKYRSFDRDFGIEMRFDGGIEEYLSRDNASWPPRVDHAAPGGKGDTHTGCPQIPIVLYELAMAGGIDEVDGEMLCGQ